MGSHSSPLPAAPTHVYRDWDEMKINYSLRTTNAWDLLNVRCPEPSRSQTIMQSMHLQIAFSVEEVNSYKLLITKSNSTTVKLVF